MDFSIIAVVAYTNRTETLNEKFGLPVPLQKIDDEMVDVSVLPLSMDDASIEAVAEIAVLMVDAEEQFFQYPST